MTYLDVEPLAAPGTYPVPPARGRWRLTLHDRAFAEPHAGPTWNQTILGELDSARARVLTRVLNQAAQLDFAIDGHEPIASAILELQVEIYAWRWDDQRGADVCVFRGVVDHSEDELDEQSHLVKFTAHDYFKLLDRRFDASTTGTTYTNVDQDGIAYQGVAAATDAVTSFGNGYYLPLLPAMVAPDGSARAASGIIRTRAYAGSYVASQLIDDLAADINGFDFDALPEPRAIGLPTWQGQAIGPGTDALRIFYPQQGTTRTDFALLYGGNVAKVTRTVDSANYANYDRQIGNKASASANVAQLIGEASNADASSTTVGLWPLLEYAPTVIDATTLTQKAQGRVADLGVLQPSYALTLRAGTYEWGYPHLGDTVPLVIQSGRLNVNTNVRVVGIAYTVGDDGQEDVVVTVGRPRLTLAQLLNQNNRDVSALARR
jgi:hypothetical protein